MTPFSVSDATQLVRKNLDELDPNGSIMYNDQGGSADQYNDNSSMNDLIERLMPEAINAVNMAAPVALLEGTDVKSSATYAAVTGDAKVLKISFASDQHYMRLVAFRAADSDIVVTDTIAEASPEGRKQHNNYIRGTADRPRLVLEQGSQDGSPSFRYYSFASNTASPTSSDIATFIILKEVRYRDTNYGYTAATTNPAVPARYDSCQRLRQNYADYITARVMETYNDARAQAYIQRALSFPAI
jgi:hypothetical protein